MTRRCSTCGEELEVGDHRCPTCGTEVRERGSVPATVRRCPRCGYRGEGVGYFRRPRHVALLVLAALFTYGIGGLIYWLIRRGDPVCPNCGLRWDARTRRLSGPVDDAESEEAPSEEIDLPAGGSWRRALGVLAILAAALVISIGLVEAEATAVAVGAVLGLGGGSLFWWGWRALQERREALMAGLQRKVLHLASRKGGTLTVTDVAARLDLSLEAAEKVLISMDDGFRVRSEITREGLLLYEFPEIQHRARLEEE